MIFSIRHLIANLKSMHNIRYYFLSDTITNARAGLVRREKNYRGRRVRLVNEELLGEERWLLLPIFMQAFPSFFFQW
jgi:hypothetical protein